MIDILEKIHILDILDPDYFEFHTVFNGFDGKLRERSEYNFIFIGNKRIEQQFRLMQSIIL